MVLMTTLTWNGTDLPKELEGLPPGRYLLVGVDVPHTLTPHEVEGLREALEQVAAGETMSHQEAKARIREVLTSK
jgi:hypothetical protein